jgi:hypothetical protein
MDQTKSSRVTHIIFKHEIYENYVKEIQKEGNSKEKYFIWSFKDLRRNVASFPELDEEGNKNKRSDIESFSRSREWILNNYPELLI